MRVKYVAVVVAMMSCLGCDDAEEEGLRVGTFNAGLAPGYVPFAEERAPLAIGALAVQDLDIACVQEVWLPADVAALRAATRTRWPHAVIPAPDPGEPLGTGPACEATELAPLSGCITSTCAGLPTDQIAGCALARCDVELGALPVSCGTCLAVNIGASFEQIQQACTTLPSPRFAFDGSFGTGLLSRYPLLAQDVLVFESSISRRGAIYSRVAAPNVGEVHVFCTHTSPIFDDIPYPGTGSWEAEQRAQIQALLGFVAEKTGGGGRVVLLGDLNTGPGWFTGITAEAELNYLLLATEFRNPYIETVETPLCTFCADNTLVPDDADSVIIDHILVRGLDADDTARRFLTGNVQIDVDGTPTTTSLSDHYGVRAALIE